MSRVFPVLVVSILLSLVILSSTTLVVDDAPSQTVYSGLNFPVAFTFAHDGRMFFNEKNTGNVRVIASNGTVLTQPFGNLGPLPPTTAGSEEGLLGLALDPNFDTNHYLYVYWTYWDGAQKHVRITRFTDAGNLGTSETNIFDFVDPNPGPTNHNGGYIKFGLDGTLYATVGDFCSWDCSGIPLAQDKTNYAGKILRMNPDGSVPFNNPFSGSLIYAYGFRNGIGLDFNSTGGLIATMAGPDCCDRIFFVNSGANLGWPNCGTRSHVACSPPYTPSLYQWGSTVTPTGIAYSSSDRVLYFGEFNTGNFMQLALTTGGTFSQLNTVASGFSGGVIAVERGPDGRIWFSTPSDILAYTLSETKGERTTTQTCMRPPNHPSPATPAQRLPNSLARWSRLLYWFQWLRQFRIPSLNALVRENVSLESQQIVT